MDDFSGVIAAHSFDTVFYILKKIIAHKKAYKGIKELRRAFNVADVTGSVIDTAIELNWNDFEDAIHYETARSAGCDAIVTRNKKDFKESELPIFTPQQFLDHLNS